jgi:hypothetical protein
MIWRWLVHNEKSRWQKSQRVSLNELIRRFNKRRTVWSIELWMAYIRAPNGELGKRQRSSGQSDKCLVDNVFYAAKQMKKYLNLLIYLNSFEFLNGRHTSLDPVNTKTSEDSKTT